MTGASRIRDRSMYVACPLCGAAPLERCRPPTGMLVHKARVKAWERAGKPQEPPR